MENYLGQMAMYVPYKKKTSSVIKNILTVQQYCLMST